jgi:hypothetical protein
VKYRYLQNKRGSRDSHIYTEIQNNDVDGRKDEWRTEAGMQFGLEKRHGKLVNIVVDAVDGWVLEHRWHLDGQGYVRRWVTVNGAQRAIRMGRVLLGLEDGDPRTADHRDRNKLNNRRSNLRILTRSEQQQNRSGWGKLGSRGVYRMPSGRYQAYGYVLLSGRQRKISLGLYDGEDEAAGVAREFRAMVMPFATD